MYFLLIFAVVLSLSVSAQAECPSAWAEFEDLCYYKIDKTKTFYDAQKSCETLGANLAIIPNAMANEFVRNMFVSGSFWVGLSSKDWGVRPQVWQDKSEVFFTNWNAGEPRDVGGVEECTEVYASSGRWNDLSCASSRSFVCSKHEDDDKEEKVVCQAGWKSYDSWCYLKVDTTLAYEDAQRQCQSMQSDLATIPDAGATEFMLSIMGLHYASYWIGLRSQDWRVRPHYWKDESMVYYTNWDAYQPSDTGGVEECAELKKGNGAWNDLACSNKRAFICSKHAQKPEDTVKVECPPGWEQFNELCYFKVDLLLDYEDAQRRCRSADADLASLPSTAANDFVKNNLKLVHSTYWIGLRSRDWNARPHHWNDGDEVTRTNWHRGGPSNAAGVEECAEMYKAYGTWNDLACTYKRAFICSKHAEIVDKDKEKLTCEHGWGAFEDKCYKKVDQLKTFSQAQQWCEDDEANLASLSNSLVNEFVETRLQLVAATYWIGLESPNWNVRPQHWKNGEVVTYSNWHAGQPTSRGGSEDCVEMYKSYGTWNDLACGSLRNFICSKPAGVVDETTASETCSKGWESVDGQCYFFVKDRQTFNDAQGRCERGGGNLATIPDAQANEYLRTDIGMSTGHYWIGLTARNWNTRPQHWIDGDEIAFTKWQTGQPNDAGGVEDCASFYNPTGTWYDYKCTTQNFYICSKHPGDKYEKLPLLPENNPETYKETIDELRVEVSDLKEENDQMENQISQKNTENAELKKEVAEQNDKNQAFEEDLINCGKEITELKEDIEDWEGANSVLNEENSDLEFDNLYQRETINYLNDEVEKKKIEIEEMKKDLEECEDLSPDEGWMDGGNEYQYTLVSNGMTYADSLAECERLGGMLATVGMRNIETRIYIATTLKVKDAWIGLNDIAKEFVHKWIDGFPGTRQNVAFAKGQPDGRKNENCDMITAGSEKDFRAHDHSCAKKFSAICEKTLPS